MRRGNFWRNALSGLNRLESTSISQSTVVGSSPGFGQAGAIVCVAIADHSSNSLPPPGIPGTSGHSGNSVGPIRRNQRFAAKSQASYQLDSGRWQWPSDYESESRSRTSELPARLHP